MIWPFKRKTETRAASSGYTAQMIQARTDYITGASGQAELTATVQGAVTLWENGLSVADVEGTDLLTRRVLAISGRMLALRGEAVFYITDDVLIPASDWDLSTRLSRPVAYRLTLPDAGGRQDHDGSCGRSAALSDRRRRQSTVVRHGTAQAGQSLGGALANNRKGAC